MKRLILLLFVMAIPLAAATALDLEFTGEIGSGYSIVDIPASTGWNPSDFNDWSEINIRANVQATYGFGSLRAGLEIGYSWLYYYDVTVIGPTYYWGFAEALNFSPIVEFRFGQAAVQAGAGIYIFDDGTPVGVHAAFTWRFPLRNPDMAIPVTVRADAIFGRALIVPVSILTGFSYFYVR